MTTRYSQLKRGRGRQIQYTQKLLPDGTTPEQMRILKLLSEDRGIPLASLRREIIRDYLLTFEFTIEEQGLIGQGELDDTKAGVY